MACSTLSTISPRSAPKREVANVSGPIEGGINYVERLLLAGCPPSVAGGGAPACPRRRRQPSPRRAGQDHIREATAAPQAGRDSSSPIGERIPLEQLDRRGGDVLQSVLRCQRRNTLRYHGDSVNSPGCEKVFAFPRTLVYAQSSNRVDDARPAAKITRHWALTNDLAPTFVDPRFRPRWHRMKPRMSHPVRCGAPRCNYLDGINLIETAQARAAPGRHEAIGNQQISAGQVESYITEPRAKGLKSHHVRRQPRFRPNVASAFRAPGRFTQSHLANRFVQRLIVGANPWMKDEESHSSKPIREPRREIRSRIQIAKIALKLARRRARVVADPIRDLAV
jgi:hypothetical protein